MWERLIPNRTYALTKGDEVEALNAGGGGFGSPLQRHVAKVVDDVRKGFVTPERARERYGVELTDGLAIDEAATRSRREREAVA